MPVVPGREYRNIDIEHFTTVPSDDGEVSYIVEGYATTFDDPYELMPGYFESIDRGALDEADMSDVIFQFNHDGMVLARMRNNTLSLFCDEHGMSVRADLKGTQQGRDLYEAIKSGLVDRMSWGFRIADDGWEFDKETKTAHITRVAKVYDVSAVSIPANEGTEISARSYIDGVIEAEQQELLKRKEDEELRAKLKLLMEITE